MQYLSLTYKKSEDGGSRTTSKTLCARGSKSPLVLMQLFEIAKTEGVVVQRKTILS